MLDIFNNDAFTLVELTEAINEIKFVPGRIGALGLFSSRGVNTLSVNIEMRNGVLHLLSPRPRGGPGETVTRGGRNMRSISVPHFQIDDAVMADEVQGVRAFGSESELETVQGKVGEHLSDHTIAFALTQEFNRLGAVKGVITYADGSEVDLFDFFGVTANTQVGLSLATADDGELRTAVSGIGRTVGDALGGLPYSGLYAIVGDNFFDTLVANPEVRANYLGWSAALELSRGTINGNAPNGSYAVFEWGGVSWDNYRGKIGSDAMVGTDDAYIFPTGVPGLFRTYYSPADYIETVNTTGQRLYTKQYEMANGKGVHLESQMNALELCTRPLALVHAVTGA